MEKIEQNERLHFELKKRQEALQEEQRIKPWRNFLFEKTFEPNKLSNKQIEDLCYEFGEVID